MSRLAPFFAVALLLTLGACGAAGVDDLLPNVPPGGSGTSQAMSSGELLWAEEVLDLVNQERISRQLSPVEWHVQGTDAAFGHSVDMHERDFFAHENPDGDGPGDRLRAAGVNWSSYGENIAIGQETPARVMAAWMGSDGHRRNILDPEFTHLGIGVHTATGGGPYWTQDFIR